MCFSGRYFQVAGRWFSSAGAQQQVRGSCSAEPQNPGNPWSSPGTKAFKYSQSKITSSNGPQNHGQRLGCLFLSHVKVTGIFFFFPRKSEVGLSRPHLEMAHRGAVRRN